MAKHISSYEMRKQELLLAIEKHEEEIVKPTKMYREYYRGKQWDAVSKSYYNNETVDNMVYSTVSSVGPSITINKPQIVVKAKKPFIDGANGEKIDATTASIKHRIMTEFLFDELDVQETMEQIVVDALICPRGVAFVGFEVNTMAVQIQDDDELLEMIRNENIFVSRISPVDLIVDIEGKDPNLSDARYIAVKWVLRPEEVKKTYGKSVPVNGSLESNEHSVTFRRFQRDESNLDVGKILGRVEGYDVWDRDTRTVYTMVLTEDHYVKTRKFPSHIDNFPIQVLWFNYNPDSSTPLADTGIYKGKQDSLNMLESQIADHTKRLSDRKYAINKNKVAKTEAETWANGPSGSVLKVKGDPTTAVTAVNDGGVSQDLYIGVNATKGDINSLMGIAQSEGGKGADFKSATAASLASQGVSPRRIFRRNKYERFIGKVLSSLMRVASAVLPASTTVPVSDNQFDGLATSNPNLLVAGDEQTSATGHRFKEVFPFVEVDRAVMSARYTYKITVEQAGADSEAVKREGATALLQMSAENPYVNQFEATKIFLEAIGMGSFVDRVLVPQEQVIQSQQAADKKNIEGQLALDLPKREADVLKTKMKTVAQMTIAGMQLDASKDSDKRKEKQDNKGNIIELIKAVEAKKKNANV